MDTLESYDKSIKNVLLLTCDNCSTNKKTAVISQVPMIGCASHGFNLAVETYLEQHAALQQVVHDLMKISFINLEIEDIKTGWKTTPANLISSYFIQCY